MLLSGEGGDEAFAGHPNYQNMSWLERVKRILSPLNGAAATGCSTLNRFLRSRKVSKYAQLMRTPFESCYYSLTSSPFSFFNNRCDELYSPALASAVNEPASVHFVTSANGLLGVVGVLMVRVVCGGSL